VSAEQAKPGKGFFGWLGRQVGHVRKAVRTDVSNKPKTVYREQTVEEQPLPQDPNVILRRTTTDEVIVNKKEVAPAPRS
jgi:hypothetical protein